jgi:Fanconi anemia group J protein
MAVIGSREYLCIHKKVSTQANKSEACADACKTGNCVYKRGVEKLVRDNTVQLTVTGGPVWDIEDLVEKGKEKDACPFFTARELSKNADIVFCPYNYITDPGIREAMQIDLTGAIVCFDEAHNLGMFDHCITRDRGKLQ